tara:strand:+ start:54 stop:695 length:642 start_codon:yes stop_codon:yes gene_type:complete
MEIIRVIKNRNYSVIANNIFKDKNISLKGKGLLALLLSLPSDWNLNIKGLTKITKEGRHSIAATISELIDHNYIERSVIRNKGMFKGYQYIVFEVPKANNPTTVNSDTENPKQLSKEENKLTIKKDIIQDLKNEVTSFDGCTNLVKVEFLEYWLEKSKSGKTRFEMQKTWDTTRRLKTWIKNNNAWYGNNKKDKLDKQVGSWLSARDMIEKNG